MVTGGCSKTTPSDDASTGAAAGTGHGGSAGQLGMGGKGASAGSGASGTSSGPPITSAPAAWAPPADCGGIGNLCPNLSGCGTRSECQLIGNVCIPEITGTSLPGQTAATPYCAAYTCMSFEDASCFCTGPAGKTVSACSSPAALAGLCVSQGQGCNGKTCCDGLTCTDDGGGVSTCEVRCSSASDCTSGCCTDLHDTGVTICADASACTNPCKKHGEACDPGSATTPNNCCRGSCVQSDNPDFGGCRPDCTTNADCTDTGCCVPYANSTSGFCADARYCSCGAVNAACSGNNPACCEGNVCAGDEANPGAFKCYKGCQTPSDCPNGDCVALADNSASLCLTTANDCSTLGAVCGGTNPSCCKGFTCAAVGNMGSTCLMSCTTDKDCGSGTCLQLSDGSGGVCVAVG